MSGSKISWHQFSILVFLFTIGSTIILIPSGLAAIAKNDAWITSIIGVSVGGLIILPFVALSRLFPNKTFTEYSEVIVGKWGGKLISLGFVVFTMTGSTTLLFYMGNFMVTMIMPETPIEALNIFFMAAIVYIVQLGIEVCARIAEILFPYVAVLLFFMIICLIPQIELTNIQPIFQSGVIPILDGAIELAATASLPCVVFCMFIKNVNNNKKVKVAFIIGLFAGGLFIIILTFLSIAVLGHELTSRNSFPSYALAKKINIGNFMQRIEVIIAIAWFITIFFKILFYFYAAVIATSQLIGLKNYKPLTLPFGILLTLFSFIVYPNTAFAAVWDSRIWVPFAFTICCIIPIGLLLIAKIKTKLRQAAG